MESTPLLEYVEGRGFSIEEMIEFLEVDRGEIM